MAGTATPPDSLKRRMKLVLLDRDGVVVVNRSDNIKRPDEIALVEGSGEAIARLNQAGYTVAVCTNQPEVGRGAMTRSALDQVHDALRDRLERRGAVIDRFFCCTSLRKCPRRKPAAGMLREALACYGARAAETPFVGDQADDLKAAFHAGCRRVLVLTGLGRKTLASGAVPSYVAPVSVWPDLASAVDGFLKEAC